MRRFLQNNFPVNSIVRLHSFVHFGDESISKDTSTSVALATVFADFLAERILGSRDQYHLALLITQSVTFVMSITGLQGITAVTEPILQIFYPMLMIMIAINLGRRWLPQSTSVQSIEREIETEKSENPVIDPAAAQ